MLPVVLLLVLCIASSLQQCPSGITTTATNATCKTGYFYTNGVCCKVLCADYVSKYSGFNTCEAMKTLGWCTNSVYEDIMKKRCIKTCNLCT